jgi:hypothetical protein
MVVFKSLLFAWTYTLLGVLIESLYLHTQAAQHLDQRHNLAETEDAKNKKEDEQYDV